MMATSSQLFEKFYSFPPFFTLQPTPQTRSRQLDLWTKLLQSNLSQSRQFILTRTETVFTNEDIKRSLSNDFITDLFTYMIDNDHAIPNSISGASPRSKQRGVAGPSGTGVESVILWFIPKEKWHEKLYDYAKNNGLQSGGIATAFEILEDPEFAGMDSKVLGVLLAGLQEERKCEVMSGGGGDIEGVKFF